MKATLFLVLIRESRNKNFDAGSREEEHFMDVTTRPAIDSLIILDKIRDKLRCEKEASC